MTRTVDIDEKTLLAGKTYYFTVLVTSEDGRIASATSRIADVIEGVQYQQEDLCRKMKAQIDAATRKDQVKPREGVRLLELYESQMLNKTYLNIEPKNGRKKKS